MKAASANKTRETEKTASDALTVLLTKLEKITKNGCFHDSKKVVKLF